jgi:hypothetical protein
MKKQNKISKKETQINLLKNQDDIKIELKGDLYDFSTLLILACMQLPDFKKSMIRAIEFLNETQNK